MTAWLPLLAFLGALTGAAIPAWVALRGQRHDKRVEWRQRFDRAIDLVSDDRPVVTRIGKALLTSLMRSELGSPDDRELAREVSNFMVRGGTMAGEQGDT